MIYLISEEILKSEGLIDNNMDPAYLKPSIQLAQDKGLQPLIGGPLYETICDMVSDNSIKDPVNQKYKFLLDEYIIPYLCFQTLAECAIPISWKFKNQGLVEANTEWTSRPYMKDFQYIVQKYENDAVFYGNRLTDYLKANSTSYPEYHRHICGKMSANDRQYKTGLYLGWGGCSCGLRSDLPDNN